MIVGNDYIKSSLSEEVLGIRDPRIRFENYIQNMGEAQNMNALLHMGRGRYFTWQCDDDLYAPNFLEEVHSALVKFDFPTCVFTSYEFIHGTSFPKMANTLSGQGQTYSGRQFLRRYLSGKLITMGCTGVYTKEYLKQIGGVECLTDSPSPLYTEYLYLIRAGLIEHVAYIGEPLVKYRFHEGSWGCTHKDLSLYKQAGENLVRKSILIFSNPVLRDDFRQNIASLLKFVVKDYLIKTWSQNEYPSRLEAMPYLFSLKKQLNSLKGSALYRYAFFSWIWKGVMPVLWEGIKIKFKLVAPPKLVKFVQSLRAPFRRYNSDSESYRD